SPATMPAPPPGRYHTLGGLVAVLLGRLPKEGDWVPWGGLRMEVLQMEQYRVSQVRITEAPKKEEASGS
ncbi:MAG: transporter associated domain-containing protein, partial [Verrucomicrobiota bacterium]|nr:transporter associated domain-containing protein [Verrucomicrobiota bacterium]